ncbi:hypothetical protein GCM10028785_03470 [Hydrogenophaga soli]
MLAVNIIMGLLLPAVSTLGGTVGDMAVDVLGGAAWVVTKQATQAKALRCFARFLL